MLSLLKLHNTFFLYNLYFYNFYAPGPKNKYFEQIFCRLINCIIYKLVDKKLNIIRLNFNFNFKTDI